MDGGRQAESRLNKEGLFLLVPNEITCEHTVHAVVNYPLTWYFKILFALIESANNERVLLIEGVHRAMFIYISSQCGRSDYCQEALLAL